GSHGNLETEYTVHAGADPSRLLVNYDGWGDVSVLPDGQLQLVNSVTGDILFAEAPTLYQVDAAGQPQAVAGKYRAEGGGQVGFEVGPSATSRDLIIAPSLAFSTYYGGTNGDRAFAVAEDASGNTYATGSTPAADSTVFPITPSAFQSTGNSTNSAA